MPGQVDHALRSFQVHLDGALQVLVELDGGRRVEHDLHIFAKNLGVGGRNAQCRQRDVAGYRRQLLKDALLAAVLRLTAQTVEDLGGIQNILN